MKINVEYLETEMLNLNHLIEDYEDLFLNLYNEMSSVSFFWNDKHAIDYLNHVKLEKMDVQTTINELKSVKEVYDYLIRNYKSLGKRISYNLSTRNDTLLKLDTYINKINDILNSYNTLDMSVDGTYIYMINTQKQLLTTDRNNIQSLKNKLKEIYNKIEETEKNVNLKIAKLDILKIKEIDINEFI